MEKQKSEKSFSMATFKNKQLQFLGWIGRWVNSGDNMKKQPMNAQNVTDLLQAVGFVVCATEEHKPENTEKKDGSVHVKVTCSDTGNVFCLKRGKNVDLTPDDPITMTLANLDVEDQGEAINLEGSRKPLSLEISKLMTSVINYLMHMMYDTQDDNSQMVSPKQIREIEPTVEVDLKPEEKTPKAEASKSEKSKPSEKRRNVPSNVLDLLKNASSTITNAISAFEAAPEIQETPTKSSKTPEDAPPAKTSWLSPTFRFFRSSSSSTTSPPTAESQPAKKPEPKTEEPPEELGPPFFHIRTSFVPNIQAISELRRMEKAQAARKELERKEAERKERERLEAARKEAQRKEFEKKEAERKEAEKKEAERKEVEREEAEKKEAERKETEKKDAERKEAERKEAEKKEAERKEVEKKEAEKIDAVKKEAELKEVEKDEVDRKETEEKEVERKIPEEELKKTEKKQAKRKEAKKEADCVEVLIN